jgi:DNA-binding NarL/FixJ family response regulator
MLALAQGETSSSRSFYTRMGDRKLWVDYRAEKVTVDGEDYALCFSNTQDNRSSTRHLESFLTHRETEIVDLLSRGASNKEIAAALEISENTVKYHLSRIYDKMEVRSRTELLSGTFLKNVRSRG